jgi:hypothetical protein
MNNGWFKIYRKLTDSDLWLSEKFTRGQAWVDLIGLANFKDSFFYKRGVKIDLNRGELAYSEVALSKRWQWSRTKVRSFLNDLEKEHQIEQQKNNVTTVIKVINYHLYQDEEQQKEQQNGQQVGQQKNSKLDTKKTAEEQQAGHQKNTYKESKEEEEKKEGKKRKKKKVVADESAPVEVSIHQRLIAVFITFFKKEFEIEYQFKGAKDGQAVKSLITSIKKQWKAKHKKLPTDDEISESFNWLLNEASKDKWYRDNFTLPIISSKINEIILTVKNRIKDGESTRKKGNSSRPSLSDEAVARKDL